MPTMLNLLQSYKHLSHLVTKLTKWLCAQQRLRSAWASAQSDQSLHCPQEESLGPSLPIGRTAKTLIRLGGCVGFVGFVMRRLIFYRKSRLLSVSFIYSSCQLSMTFSKEIWAATWQNQQNECAPSEDSDQPGHPPSLIRVFAVRLMGS